MYSELFLKHNNVIKCEIMQIILLKKTKDDVISSLNKNVSIERLKKCK